MKESYRENLASSSGLEPYADDGDIVGVASGRGDTGQPLSSEIRESRVPILYPHGEGSIDHTAKGKVWADAAESETLCMCRNSKRENREIPLASAEHEGQLRVRRIAQQTFQTAQLG